VKARGVETVGEPDEGKPHVRFDVGVAGDESDRDLEDYAPVAYTGEAPCLDRSSRLPPTLPVRRGSVDPG
jgi:hypothetical protein